MDQAAQSLTSDASTANVGVAIVTYNGASWISQCLSSLRDKTGLALSVVVVDNGSTDGTLELVCAGFPEVSVFRCDENVGFGVGNNLAIATLLQQDCEFILLLNQDAYVLPSALDSLVAFMRAQPGVGVASPLHCSPDAEHLDAKTARGYLALKAPQVLEDALLGRLQQSYEIAGLNAAVWLVRSEVFRRVGGFDPLFFMYGEDDDLMGRLRDHHVRFALVPSIRVVHQRQSPAAPPARSAWGRVARGARRERSSLLVRLKRPHLSLAFRLRLLVAQGLLRPFADWLVEARSTDLLSAWYATWQVLRQLGLIGQHARRLAAAGPHFLDEASLPRGRWVVPLPARSQEPPPTRQTWTGSKP